MWVESSCGWWTVEHQSRSPIYFHINIYGKDMKTTLSLQPAMG